MELPTRGFLVNPDDTIVWAWEHNDPTTDFTSLPPFVTTMDGETHSVADPGAVVVDLEAEGLEPRDLNLLLRDLSAARCRRQPNGTLCIRQVLPTGNEIDHPIMAVIAARRQQRSNP